MQGTECPASDHKFQQITSRNRQFCLPAHRLLGLGQACFTDFVISGQGVLPCSDSVRDRPQQLRRHYYTFSLQRTALWGADVLYFPSSKFSSCVVDRPFPSMQVSGSQHIHRMCSLHRRLPLNISSPRKEVPPASSHPAVLPALAAGRH